MSSLIIENFLFSAESLIKGELWRLFKATLFNDSTFNGDIAFNVDICYGLEVGGASLHL